MDPLAGFFAGALAGVVAGAIGTAVAFLRVFKTHYVVLGDDIQAELAQVLKAREAS